MNKKIMSKLIVASVLVGGVNFLPVNFSAQKFQIVSIAHAEVKTVEADDIAMFDFGENDAQIVETVKNMARTRALQAAREKAGIYLQSQTQVVNGVLTKDDISAVTNNISEIMDVRYERSMFNALDANDNPYGKVGIMYTAYVTVKIDTNGISEYLQKTEQEKAKIIEQDRNFKNSVLESVGNFENVRANAKNQNLEQVHSELQKIDKEITATEKISEGNKLAYQNNYSAAVSKYTEALEINPSDSAAQKNIESIYSEQNSNNYNDSFRIKVFEFEGTGTAPADTTGERARIFANVAGRADAYRKAVEYLNNYVSDIGKNPKNNETKQMIIQIVKNMKIVSEQILGDGRCVIKVRFTDEDITRLENFLKLK